MILTERAHIHVAALTDDGARGKKNEDRYSVTVYRVGPRNPTPSLLAIVADGIGGHRAGEIAAEIAVEIITEDVAQSDAKRPLETLEKAIIRAGETVRDEADTQTEQAGMGSTCVCVWVIGDRLHIASVGDSRIYLLRNGHLQQLTTDHTWVQEAVEYGALTPKQARGHPNANVIRRYLGSRKTVEPDFRLRMHPDDIPAQLESNQGLRLQVGDQLLLCSDGLTDLVEDDEIQEILEERQGEEALQELTDLANARGGHDNITSVILNVQEDFYKPTISLGGLLHLTPDQFSCLGIASLALIILAAISFMIWFFLRPDAAPTPTLTQPPAATQPAGLDATQTAGPSATPIPSQQSNTTQTYTPWPTATNDKDDKDRKTTSTIPPPSETPVGY